MTALSIIIDIVLILISIVLIVTVLMQEGQRQGLGAIGGGAETFFGKNKAKSMEGKLQKYTKIAATVFIVLAIVATVITAHNRTSSAPIAIDDAVVEEAVKEVMGLIKGGYASGKGYVASCEKIIMKYKLYLYDKVAAENSKL